MVLNIEIYCLSNNLIFFKNNTVKYFIFSYIYYYIILTHMISLRKYKIKTLNVEILYKIYRYLS